jgi:hypothetical protein
VQVSAAFLPHPSVSARRRPRSGMLDRPLVGQRRGGVAAGAEDDPLGIEGDDAGNWRSRPDGYSGRRSGRTPAVRRRAAWRRRPSGSCRAGRAAGRRRGGRTARRRGRRAATRQSLLHAVAFAENYYTAPGVGWKHPRATFPVYLVPDRSGGGRGQAALDLRSMPGPSGGMLRDAIQSDMRHLGRHRRANLRAVALASPDGGTDATEGAPSRDRHRGPRTR